LHCAPIQGAAFCATCPAARLVGGGRHEIQVALHHTDEGISVSVPALPGCWSEGDTEEEALANIRDAIQGYLAALEDRLQGAEVRELEV
jgi:predicted RNase H-like HicB family nuclease